MIVINHVYELPFGKGHSLLNNGGAAGAILGGWQLSGIFRYFTGLPFTAAAAATNAGARPVRLSRRSSERHSIRGYTGRASNISLRRPSLWRQSIRAVTRAVITSAAPALLSTMPTLFASFTLRSE